MTFDFSEFKNKKIIVTGSSTGIGFETGIEFLIIPHFSAVISSTESPKRCVWSKSISVIIVWIGDKTFVESNLW